MFYSAFCIIKDMESSNSKILSQQRSMLRNVLCDGESLINMDDFLFKLGEEQLITIAEAKETKKKGSCAKKAQYLFSIVSLKTSKLKYEELLQRLLNQVKDVDARSSPPGSLEDVFKRNWDFLADDMDTEKVAYILLKSRILSSEDRKDIIAQGVQRDKTTLVILKLTSKMNFRIFNKFLGALVNVGQSHIAEKLWTQWGDMVGEHLDLGDAIISDEWEIRMERVHLLRSITCDGEELIDMDDFLFNLREEGLITTAESKEIKERQDCEGKVQYFLAIIAAKSSRITYEKLRNALVDWMKGVREGRIGTPTSLQGIILNNWDFLMERIELQVLTHLLRVGILTAKDRTDIITLRKERHQKTVLLVKLAARIDFSIFEKVLDALVDAQHVDIAENLRSQWMDIAREHPDLIDTIMSGMPSHNDIRMIARTIQLEEDDWEDLGRELGLDDDSLGEIRQMKLSPLESAYLMLSEWRTSTSHYRQPTFAALRAALLEKGMEKTAEEIVDLICRRFAMKSSGDTYLECFFRNLYI
ncbi:unnamed protein product [Darwinula stevensoni]|uniref:Death domain-containing protein n=1 Tax=Darwinula stevensoni TaxID=69355 RepID=A0A7R9A619_9CRUS|nr:unnamed protein product [Darwinula stevensoni]CAG0895679.1 unnamed protein product [Darwinula stevensoni]